MIKISWFVILKSLERNLSNGTGTRIKEKIQGGYNTEIQTVIPIRKERALAPLTETELMVLETLAREGEKAAPHKSHDQEGSGYNNVAVEEPSFLVFRHGET